jgi:hypothetical protein
MFATVQQVRENTIFTDEVANMSDEQVTRLIRRSERWIERATSHNFTDETDEGTLFDLETATLLLVDYFIYWDTPEVREQSFDTASGVSSEKIGSYSYNISASAAAQGEETGNPELDSIIDSLKNLYTDTSAALFFKVSGPRG